MADKRIRIGLVGCGFISEWHLRAWRQIAEAEVVALCDRDLTRLNEMGDRHGIAARFTDLGAMLRGAELEAIDLGTGPVGRVDMVRAVAAAGKHLLVQKPLADTNAVAAELVAIAGSAGVRMMVKENWRWSPWYQAMKRALDEGLVGEARHLQIVRTCWGSPNPEWQVWAEQPYFRDLVRAAWFDVGGHFVDTLRNLLGEPLSLSAEMARVSPLMKGEDLVQVALRFPECFATCDLSWAERGRPSRAAADRVRLDGTRGSIEVEESGRVVHRDNFGGWRVLGGPWPDGDLASHIGSQANFARALLGREEMATPVHHNARTLEIVLAAYDSAESDRKVRLV